MREDSEPPAARALERRQKVLALAAEHVNGTESGFTDRTKRMNAKDRVYAELAVAAFLAGD